MGGYKKGLSIPKALGICVLIWMVTVFPVVFLIAWGCSHAFLNPDDGAIMSAMGGFIWGLCVTGYLMAVYDNLRWGFKHWWRP